MYDANLVLTEEFSIAGAIDSQQVGDYIDMEQLRGSLATGQLFLEIECLEKPAGTTLGWFQFSLVANDTPTVFSGSPFPITVASTPFVGTPVHFYFSGAPFYPEAGAKMLVPVGAQCVNWLPADQANLTAYGRRYLCLVFTNATRILTAGVAGTFSAGKFRASLRVGLPTGAHAYPSAF